MAESKLLTEKDTSKVIKALRDAKVKWRQIGTELNILIVDLETIQIESGNRVDECLQKMVTLWLKRRSLNPSWQSLVKALREVTVDEEGVAADIEEKFIKAKKPDTKDKASQDSSLSQYHESITTTGDSMPVDVVCQPPPLKRQKMNDHNTTVEQVTKHQDDIRRALTDIDTRIKELEDQKVAIEDDIDTQFNQFHGALNQRKLELVEQLGQLTQRKVKNLAEQKEQVKLQAQDSSASVGVPALTGSAHTRKVLAPREKANMKLVADSHTLEQLCHTYGKVVSEDLKDEVTGIGSKAAVVGVHASFVLQCVDAQGREISVENISAMLDSCTGTEISCKVSKRKMYGKYTVTYKPTTRGRHQLHIKIGQTPIGCSPLPVVVTLPPQRLGDPVRSIGKFTCPYGIAVGNGGQIYITEKDANSIYILTSEGQKVTTLHTVQGPWGICLDDDGNILVAGNNDHQIHKFTSGGQFLQSVGIRGSKASKRSKQLQFTHPVGVLYSDKNQKIYITEAGNNRIQVLNKDLTFSTTFGKSGSENGQFSTPCGMAVDSKGQLYVADYGNNRIQVFKSNGKFSQVVNIDGKGSGGPRDIHIDSTDTVYVLDARRKCVSVFDTHGKLHTSFGQKCFSDPLGITMDENGYIAVVDSKKKAVQFF